VNTPFVLALTLALAASLTAACDEGPVATEAAAVPAPSQTISLREAVRAAETHERGTAIEATLDDDRSVPVYEVSVLRDNRVYEVSVAMADGSVIGSRPDVDD
jgi:uncharacterized membrane protein YkoI